MTSAEHVSSGIEKHVDWIISCLLRMTFLDVLTFIIKNLVACFPENLPLNKILKFADVLPLIQVASSALSHGWSLHFPL